MRGLLMRIPLRRPVAVVAVAGLLLVPSAAMASEDAATQGVGASAAAHPSRARPNAPHCDMPSPWPNPDP